MNLVGGDLRMIIPEDHAIVKLRKDVPWKEITAICDRAYQGREMK